MQPITKLYAVTRIIVFLRVENQEALIANANI